MAAAGPSLDSPSATRASRLILQTVIDVNVNAVYSPSLAKSRLNAHPCAILLINYLFSGRDDGGKGVKREIGIYSWQDVRPDSAHLLF